MSESKQQPETTGPVNPNYRVKKMPLLTPEEYAGGIISGNRVILSQAITLLESSKEEHLALGQKILEECLPKTGNSIRIAVTGLPGAGKSTFIETLGQHLIAQGNKVAVLSVDPSSDRSKGSILGDKTRMPALSAHDQAFIRPSPASGTLGGVARKTREAMLLCEAAGYNIILIETVGVGQSETAVHSMVDFFLLLLLGGAGDELQGIKRGIMEMADLVAINKADGENEKAAERAKREYQNALSLFPSSPSGWKPPVLSCSALNSTGITGIWEEIENYLNLTRRNGYFDSRRKDQGIYWMHETIHQQLKHQFYRHPEIEKNLGKTEERIKKGEISSFKAASELLKIFNPDN